MPPAPGKPETPTTTTTTMTMTPILQADDTTKSQIHPSIIPGSRDPNQSTQEDHQDDDFGTFLWTDVPKLDPDRRTSPDFLVLRPQELMRQAMDELVELLHWLVLTQLWIKRTESHPLMFSIPSSTLRPGTDDPAGSDLQQDPDTVYGLEAVSTPEDDTQTLIFPPTPIAASLATTTSGSATATATAPATATSTQHSSSSSSGGKRKTKKDSSQHRQFPIRNSEYTAALITFDRSTSSRDLLVLLKHIHKAHSYYGAEVSRAAGHLARLVSFAQYRTYVAGFRLQFFSTQQFTSGWDNLSLVGRVEHMFRLINILMARAEIAAEELRTEHRLQSLADALDSHCRTLSRMQNLVFGFMHRSCFRPPTPGGQGTLEEQKQRLQERLQSIHSTLTQPQQEDEAAEDVGKTHEAINSSHGSAEDKNGETPEKIDDDESSSSADQDPEESRRNQTRSWLLSVFGGRFPSQMKPSSADPNSSVDSVWKISSEHRPQFDFLGETYRWALVDLPEEQTPEKLKSSLTSSSPDASKDGQKDTTDTTPAVPDPEIQDILKARVVLRHPSTDPFRASELDLAHRALDYVALLLSRSLTVEPVVPLVVENLVQMCGGNINSAEGTKLLLRAYPILVRSTAEQLPSQQRLGLLVDACTADLQFSIPFFLTHILPRFGAGPPGAGSGFAERILKTFPKFLQLQNILDGFGNSRLHSILRHQKQEEDGSAGAASVVDYRHPEKLPAVSRREGSLELEAFLRDVGESCGPLTAAMDPESSNPFFRGLQECFHRIAESQTCQAVTRLSSRHQAIAEIIFPAVLVPAKSSRVDMEEESIPSPLLSLLKESENRLAELLQRFQEDSIEQSTTADNEKADQKSSPSAAAGEEEERLCVEALSWHTRVLDFSLEATPTIAADALAQARRPAEISNHHHHTAGNSRNASAGEPSHHHHRHHHSRNHHHHQQQHQNSHQKSRRQGNSTVSSSASTSAAPGGQNVMTGYFQSHYAAAAAAAGTGGGAGSATAAPHTYYTAMSQFYPPQHHPQHPNHYPPHQVHPNPQQYYSVYATTTGAAASGGTASGYHPAAVAGHQHSTAAVSQWMPYTAATSGAASSHPQHPQHTQHPQHPAPQVQWVYAPAAAGYTHPQQHHNQQASAEQQQVYTHHPGHYSPTAAGHRNSSGSGGGSGGSAPASDAGSVPAEHSPVHHLHHPSQQQQQPRYYDYSQATTGMPQIAAPVSAHPAYPPMTAAAGAGNPQFVKTAWVQQDPAELVCANCISSRPVNPQTGLCEALHSRSGSTGGGGVGHASNSNPSGGKGNQGSCTLYCNPDNPCQFQNNCNRPKCWRYHPAGRYRVGLSSGHSQRPTVSQPLFSHAGDYAQYAALMMSQAGHLQHHQNQQPQQQQQHVQSNPAQESLHTAPAGLSDPSSSHHHPTVTTPVCRNCISSRTVIGPNGFCVTPEEEDCNTNCKPWKSCKHGDRCNSRYCWFFHSSGRMRIGLSIPRPCMFDEKCHSVNCTFAHTNGDQRQGIHPCPKLLRFGKCPDMPRCNHNHLLTPEDKQRQQQQKLQKKRQQQQGQQNPSAEDVESGKTSEASLPTTAAVAAAADPQPVEENPVEAVEEQPKKE